MTNDLRHQTGAPASQGGQFKTQPAPEATVALDDPETDQLIVLGFGDCEAFIGEQGSALPMVRLTRTQPDHNDDWHEDRYTIEVEQIANFLNLAPADEADPQQWLDRNRGPIGEFLTSQYGASIGETSQPSERTRVVFSVEHDGLVNGSVAWDIAEQETKAVQFHNEDTAELSRRLIERVAQYSTTDPSIDIRTARELDDRALNAEVDLRKGEREIRDSTAIAIAYKLDADYTEYPELHRLCSEGWAHRDRLNDELREQYEESTHPRTRDRLNMMFTWNLHGGEGV